MLAVLLFFFCAGAVWRWRRAPRGNGRPWGAVLGGAMGAAAIALHLSLPLHLGISAVVFAAVACVAYPFLLTGPDSDDGLADQGPEAITQWAEDRLLELEAASR